MREKKSIRDYLWVRIFFIVLITVLIIMTLFIAAWQKNTINYLFHSEEKKILCLAPAFPSLDAGTHMRSWDNAGGCDT